MKTAVIVPTIRPEKFRMEFLPAWRSHFLDYNAHLYVVYDGHRPECHLIDVETGRWASLEHPSDGVHDVIYHHTDACRNLGILHAARGEYDMFLSLDDDVLPADGRSADLIGDHIRALDQTCTPDWMNTAFSYRMRGLPYTLPIARPVLSHGVWAGVPDFDAIQQLQNPNVHDLAFPRQHVPRGAFFPVCAMNFAFRRELLPWVYQAPQGVKLQEDGLPVFDRFADIWAGVVMKYAIDNILPDACAVSGYAKVYHARASNVWANLRKEAPGMELNESFYRHVHEVAGEAEPENYLHPYLKLYREKLQLWQQLLP